MLNIDLEPLKKLYEEILNTQALSEKELQELKELIDKLNETKEEIENSSFTILQKNNTLLTKSTNILHNIDKMSNMLLHLEEKIEKEKVNFDKEIKEKFDNLLSSLKNSISLISSQILNEKTKIEREFKNFRENIENELQNTKKVILREKDELKAIRKQYEEKLENSLNSFKEKIDEYDEEVAKKTFLKRWGAVIGAFAIGVAVSLIFLVPTIKEKIKADKIVQIVKIKDPQAQEIIAKLQKKNNKLKDKIAELEKWKIPNDYIFNDGKYYYLGIPSNDIEKIKNGEKYCFLKLFKMEK